MGKTAALPPFVNRKNGNKIFRATFQVIVLLSLLILLIKVLFFGARYQDPAVALSETPDTGFIVLSYFGVDRGDSTQSLISTQRLDEHLRALYDLGYVTISQQDILDYYHDGKLLPEKALFLMFEDGRTDTAIFTQPMLERYNFRATALTYAENLVVDSPKFMQADDLKQLRDTTFWELGSNGYRLAYINVFDRHGNFLDVLDTLRFQMMSPYLDRRYDHYLMDFIRDEHSVPKESPEEMRQRISRDYEKLRQVYTDKLGEVPGMYILMHSNTNYLGTNPKAGEVNAQWIPELFSLHFNREGDCFNTADSGVYDLTRVQPSPYWYTNHLLMRIRDDTGAELEFVTGDVDRSLDWDTLLGAAEYKEEKIVLTSLPRGDGMLRWNGGSLEDLRLTTALDGNKAGGQAIYLRADELLERNYLSVGVTANIFQVIEKADNAPECVLFAMNLDLHDGTYIQSLEENRREAEARKLEMDTRYAETPQQARDSALEMNQRQNEPAPTIEEGAEEYLPPIERRAFGHRALDITLLGRELTVLVDGKPIVENLPVEVSGDGHIFLEASDAGEGYSERKLVDDVYDGVFADLVIYSIEDNQNGEELALYDNRIGGMEKVTTTVVNAWNAVIDWFIKTL